MADDGSPMNGSRSKGNSALLDTAFLYGGSAQWIEQMQAAYAKNPSSVPESWRAFFADMGDDSSSAERNAEGATWKRSDWPRPALDEQVAAFDGNWALLEPKLEKKIKGARPAASDEDVHRAVKDSIRAIMMIRAYRMRGHLAAQLDPLRLDNPGDQPELDPATYGFTAEDMDRRIFIDGYLGLETATIPEMLEILQRTYCSTIGIEFMHISDPEEKSWLQERIEGPDKGVAFTNEGKKAILAKLIEAETFERFLHKRYPGTKRFGLDGGEAAVPALEQIIKRGGALGVKEIVVGMPHRGRLNMLAAVMGKPYEQIFHEFQGGNTQGADAFGSGDVKYHLGASSDREFDGNKVHLSMNANPSHLEAVDPVVLGKSRSKQEMAHRETGTLDRSIVLPLLLHGDAAFAGQGVVSECFALSGLQGYRTGGTIHFIVNNQIGFTTSPMYSRSSPYPSDVALMVQAPIFHVNGDDPEAVTYAAKVATEYRQKFHKDVVIDMFCYRRFGHNEGDEPMFTQPVMYKKIKNHVSTREIYAQTPRRGRSSDGGAGRAAGRPTSNPISTESLTPARISRRRKPTGWTANGRASACRMMMSAAARPALPRNACRRLASPSRPCRKASTSTARSPVSSTTVPRRSSKGQGLDWATAEHPGFCDASGRRLPSAPVRPGLRPRHVLSAPQPHCRPDDRREIHAAEQYQRQARLSTK
jgi:2-oxoglutarate dehydrogenase E1 component